MLRSNSRSQGNPWNPEEDQTTAFSAMLYCGLLLLDCISFLSVLALP